jgi:diacylglycerol kinase family enzyme
MKRKQHASASLAVDNERKSVHQVQKSAMISRKQMQDRMEKEVETLRVFQEELRGQVDLLKVAFARKSMEGDNVIVRGGDGNVDSTSGGLSVKKER